MLGSTYQLQDRPCQLVVMPLQQLEMFKLQLWIHKRQGLYILRYMQPLGLNS